MADNPFDAIETHPTINTTNTTENKENIMSEGKIVITEKAGAGYDAPWIVTHASSAAEGYEILNSEEYKQLMEITTQRAAEFAKLMPSKAPAARSGSQAPQGKPQGASQAPGGATPPEGYVFKSGIAKSGKNVGQPWQAFMPIDRNAGLPTIWLDKDGNPQK